MTQDPTPGSKPYETDLDRNPANYAPLSPLSFLPRAAAVFPERTAVVHGAERRTWAEAYERCRRLASALAQRGLGKGDTVAVMAPNTPPMWEAHHGVPMAGAVLNALNARLDAAAIAFILEHGEAKVLITDTEFAPIIEAVLAELDREILVIDIDDPQGPQEPGAATPGQRSTTRPSWPRAIRTSPGPCPATSGDAISLNYTSGTTGNPKGVVYHHRGAYLNALGNVMTWGMGPHPVYLWTLPMFHCNGWCFPWTITALAGTHVCLRRVEAGAIYQAFAEQGVTHLCGAPIVMQMILGATEERAPDFPQQVEMMTAAAPPPAAVLAAMARRASR